MQRKNICKKQWLSNGSAVGVNKPILRANKQSVHTLFMLTFLKMLMNSILKHVIVICEELLASLQYIFRRK